MALSVEAQLDLEIDGQAATLTGSGQVLTLTLSSARILRNLRTLSLPALPLFGGQTLTFREVPGLLAQQGLTLAVADRKGLLLTLGAGASGKSLTVPGFGILAHTALAGRRAGLRLAFGA